jgi:very-short-patch-repair endonuclease
MTGAGEQRSRLTVTLREQDHVISRQQVLACGLTEAALTHGIRPGGPWKRLLPGIYLAQTGRPSAEQKEIAALLHAGPSAVLTGPAALRLLGITTAEPERFDVLVPVQRRPESVSFVVVHRTNRMPRYIRHGGRSYAMPARALADTARGMTDLREVRALIAGAIQRGDTTVGELTSELDEGHRPGSGLLRRVLAEAGDGVRSVAEAELRELIKRAKLPMPMFNARLYAADRAFIAVADAWWPDAGVVAEVDSREWHLKPADWERTMRRHDLLISHGILVLHFSPAQIRRRPAEVVAAIAGALRAGRDRPPLPVTARAAA